MANRVTMRRGDGTYGFFVSKPGANVLTTGAANLLINSSGEPLLQVIESGETTNPGANGTRTITYPNVGFNPMIVASCARWNVEIEYLSATQARLTARARSGIGVPSWFSGAIRWFALNIPVT